jgi:hypothetical protein
VAFTFSHRQHLANHEGSRLLPPVQRYSGRHTPAHADAQLPPSATDRQHPTACQAMSELGLKPLSSQGLCSGTAMDDNSLLMTVRAQRPNPSPNKHEHKHTAYCKARDTQDQSKAPAVGTHATSLLQECGHGTKRPQHTHPWALRHGLSMTLRACSANQRWQQGWQCRQHTTHTNMQRDACCRRAQARHLRRTWCSANKDDSERLDSTQRCVAMARDYSTLLTQHA